MSQVAPGRGGQSRPGPAGRLGDLEAPAAPPARPGDGWQGGGTSAGTVVKYLLLLAVNGAALVALPRLLAEQAWTFLAFLVLSTVAIDVAYLGKRRLPLKYLVPGTIFLVAFQIYPVVYTAYISFTNYGTGNNLSKAQAIEQIQAQNLLSPPDAVRYAAIPFATEGGDLALLLTDPDGEQFLGTPEGIQPLEEAGEVTGSDEQVEAVGDYRRLNLREAQDRQAELQELRIPAGEGEDAGEIRLTTFTEATRLEPRYVYDDQADELTDTTTGTVYTPVDGRFTSPDGEALTPGWIATIGWENYTRAFTSPAIRGPFLQIFVWTYVFALLSVLLTFVVGLGLAVTLNDEGLRSRKIYRALLIVPYALPSFLSALIWRGLLNTDFGQVNRMLDATIPWLERGNLAKFSVLLVNTWLGFPYMFLVTTGALQSIPGDLIEAAKVDGASAFSAFRRITFPLLLVSVAPLLIASFAFNFNNFNIIYLLTEGDPPIPGATTPAGQTDLLISYTYRLAFAGGSGQDFGFAAAISVIIFIMVAAISAYSFRYTRALEEVNR